MAAENTTGFKIDDLIYPMPALDTLNVDEAQVLYDYSKLTIEDFVKPEELDDDEFEELLKPKLRNPGFMRALMHIAYQRGNPRYPAGKVRDAVGSANLISAVESLADTAEREDDAVPPASTTEPEQPLGRNSVYSNASSGAGSTTSSDEPADLHASTTTSESDMSSMSGRETSET